MDLGSPAVSIIVPAYRTEDTIAETLESIFRQTFTNFEVVIVSNEGYANEEDLTRVLQPWAERIVRVRQKTPGLANARNAALPFCRAPLIALLDSDDIWEPDYLEVQVGMMLADPSIAVVYCNAVFFGDPATAGQTFMQWFPSHGPVTFLSLLKKETCVFVSVTARLDAVRKAGDFDGSLAGAEDLDLWLRIARQGGKFAYHDKPLVRYRARPTSLSNDPEVMGGHLLAVLQKNSALPDLNPEERACVAEMIALQQAQISFVRGKRALYHSEFADAIRCISESNRRLKRAKLSLILIAIRLAPNLLLSWVRHRYPTEHSFMHS